MLTVIDNRTPLPRPLIWAVLAFLPFCFTVAAFWLRTEAGPFWVWRHLDPDYFYLFDALNLLNLNAPGHVAHPGTPLQWIGTLVLKLQYLVTDGAGIAAQVLADPEPHLGRIGAVLILLNGAVLLAAGAAGYLTTGRLVFALLIQLGPLLSMLTFKFGLRVKPETLLIFTSMMLALVTALALKAGRLEAHKLRFSIAFGVIAGFGVATKITAAPVFLLPVFLLGGVRPWFAYGLTAAAAFVVFALPAAGSAGQFFGWIAQVSAGSGAFGGGEQTFIDTARYPAAVYKMFVRPALSVPFILGMLALAWTFIRLRHEAWKVLECRALAGVCLAQLAQVLVVAKQPSGHYMIPAYVLGGLGLALAVRLTLDTGRKTGPGSPWPGRIAAVLVGALIIAQGASLNRLYKELRHFREAALSIPHDRFGQCARIHYYSSSGPVFALYLGDFVTGSRFAELIGPGQPKNDYWIEDWYQDSRGDLRNWSGVQDFGTVLSQYPCAVYRGIHGGRLQRFLAKAKPGYRFDETCKTGFETVYTKGVDCQDSLIP